MLVDSAILPNGDLWVTGGYNGDNDVLSSTDIVDQYLNIKRGPDLPLEVHYHCMVNWNSSHMLLTGGTVEGTGFDLKYACISLLECRFILLILVSMTG